jgi:hypothetical protein
MICLGLRSSMGSLARAISPLVNGQLFDIQFQLVDNPHFVPFLFCSCLLLIAAAMIRIADPKQVKETIEGEKEKQNEKETENKEEEQPTEYTKLIN